MYEKLNVFIYLNLYNCYILFELCVKGVFGVL